MLLHYLQRQLVMFMRDQPQDIFLRLGNEILRLSSGDPILASEITNRWQ